MPELGAKGWPEILAGGSGGLRAQGWSPGKGSGDGPTEAEAFHRNRYKVLIVHVRKFNKLDC